jgi:hypothetical protein
MTHQGDHRYFEAALRADREMQPKATVARKDTAPRPCRLEGRPYE